MYAEKRQAEARRIRDKYPDRIPVRRLFASQFESWMYLIDLYKYILNLVLH